MSPWQWFRKLYDYLLSLFWSTELDITLLGLQNAGKTSLLRVLVGEGFSPESIPTVGFAMKRVKMGSVTLKCWDLGGQPRFRSMWERYCKGVNAIVFVLDSADESNFESAKRELHSLTKKETLEEIPLLVLGNKNDLDNALSVDEVIEKMDLNSIKNRQVSCYSISVKEASNLNSVLSWLISKSK
ncbi:ADP-ribosylation factor 1 [Trichomonascus vanleenenianus]|uniref:ADP-ribosylation factor-like protein n=1 Tax=Trichomonascus vanleenenianus TaxID=2268995 RepID=UPI003ECA682F